MGVYGNHIKVSKIIEKCKITQIFIPVVLILFLWLKKVVKKGYYGNESLVLVWDCMEVC